MTRLSPLASVSETRAALEAHGLSTKYSLGQHFLINDGILRKIVALADLEPDDYVLEVGPGIGTLTIALLKSAGRVLSVERDPDLPAVLVETLAPWSDRFTLISKDALDLTAGDVRMAGVEASGALPNKLVANLPYAVAATVVLDYLEAFPSLDSATVMVQKEVAERMTAGPGTKNYGAYTVKLRLRAEPDGRFAVGPGNFFPPPRVDSTVVRLNRRTVRDDAGVPLDEAAIAAACTMAEAAFATRRKTLWNSCKVYFAGRGASGARVVAALPQLFERAGIDPKLRGETLAVPAFIRLGRAYQQLGSPA